MAMEKSLTLAEVHRAMGRLDGALEVLAGLLEVARAKGLEAWLVRGLALQAVVYHAQGRDARALNTLAEALTLAEPEGYVRSFVDRGPALATLLQEAAGQGVTPDYVNDLLSAFDEDLELPTPPRAQPLIEPLSARELEVLSLVAEGLSNREVGRRLHIAESTVKSHLNSVYGKLAVDNRTQAAAKARALNLL
jgi:LuxR family maltose regulon positive regulatory protein